MQKSEQRKCTEIAHGRQIAPIAERVWQRHTVVGQRRLENRFADLAAYFTPSRQQALLEIGCGTGAWTRVVARLPLAITGLDLSEDLLALARNKHPDGAVRFIQGDAEAIPAADSVFDYVCGLSILHHLHVATALREIYRVLKPGGKIWFSEPNMLNPQILMQKNIPWLKRWAGDTPTETAFFRWSIGRAFENAGFRSINVQPFDFLHPHVPAFAVPCVDCLGAWLERMPCVREIGGSLAIHAQKSA